MINIDGNSNAIVSTNAVEIDTHGFEDIEIRNSNLMVTGIDNNYDVQVENLEDLDITVAKKEYTITGDDIYIPQLYDDAPQWMKDLVGLVVDVSMTTNSTKLINDMNAMLQKFAVSYVPLNQYTQSILDLGNEDMRLNALIETLNSNFSNGLSNANAQIINLQMTKASKDEVVAQVIQTLAAQLANPNSNLGATVVRLDQAIVAEQTARATSFRALTASMESINGEIAAKAEVLENALAYVGINEAGASTNTGLSAYLQASNGVIGGADSKVANDMRITAQGVESKWEYNSLLKLGNYTYNSGFGIATSLTPNSGLAAGASEFWIKADKFKLMSASGTKKSTYSPFTVDANTGSIKFNGTVEFTSIANTPVINKTYVQTSQPTSGMNKGDTWIDTDDRNTLYTYNGTSWVMTQSGAKNYLQAAAPTSGMTAGDVWIDSDDNYKQYRYNGSSWVVIAYNPATAINTNTTTINGGKIETRSITAAQIKASTITANEIAAKGITADRIGSTTGNSTVWYGGGLVSANFNGNVHGNIGSPTNGFRLSSNAAGTSTDPNIYGAYIKGATLEGTRMNTSDIKVIAEGYPENFGPITLLEVLNGGTSSVFYSRSYGTGYNSKRMCSTSQVFVLQAITVGGYSIYDSIRTGVDIQVSINGDAWNTIASGEGYVGIAACSVTYTADSTKNVQFRSMHSSSRVSSKTFSIQSVNGQ